MRAALLAPAGQGTRRPPEMKWVCCSLAAACHPVANTHLTWGKGGCGFLASAALPRWGKGRCWCACSTLFALRGKSASELARRFWSVHGKEFFAGRFAHQETFPARRETELRGTSHRFCFSRRISGARHTVETVFFPLYLLFAPAKGHLPALPAATSSPTIPRGERRALPAPAQGANPLGIPFWGMATVSPAAPVPQPPQAASPCSWGGRASNPSQRHRPAALPPLDFWGVLL